MWAWLKDEGNQKALALIGGFFAFLWSAGWAVFVYKWPPKATKSDSPPATPAHERHHNQSPKPLVRKWSPSSVLGAPAFKIWVGGILVALAFYFGGRPILVKQR
jgi:hypothetical protein